MKLSLVEEVVKDCFLIFDDAFINFDIERLIRFLYLILDESSERQIIYFTCHKREEDFLKLKILMLIEYNWRIDDICSS